MGLFGNIFIAHFFDFNGNYIGNKKIQFSFKKGITKKTFKYQNGTYNINSKLSQTETCYFPYLFNHYNYVYTIGNPDGLNFRHGIKPLMSAEAYNIQLENKVLRDLNNVRQNGLLALLTPRNIIIILIICGILYYLSSGGDVSGIAQ